MRTLDPRQFAGDRVSQNPGGGGDLRTPILRDARLQFLEQQIARHRVFDPGENLRHDPKRGWRDSCGHAGVHTLSQHAHAQLAGEISPQRCSAPDLVVIAAFGVETDDE